MKRWKHYFVCLCGQVWVSYSSTKEEKGECIRCLKLIKAQEVVEDF
jgi:hypothetical protein